ncbi:peptidoglycan DD-metalloendopeptidase family protein [Limnohabitans sp. Rim11]|uniref:peptidoglycan DD-metalloendopeptidase family protein n=1 Tax=Limnohabitans sp. Rim11 TaxID=1100719 RepID=UPI000B0C1724|nr:peptidoglycan DD-metalloendopeptidase family protein [Limnohabitans sp. Rim11]
MKRLDARLGLTVLCILATCALVACSSKPRGPIPVEDRVAGQPPVRAQQQPMQAQRQSSPVAVSSPVSMGTLPGAENAGKPGYYSVRPGDTLTKIALENGQAWRDIAKWNGLDNPNVIEVDQVLRVVPPATVAAKPAANTVATNTTATSSATSQANAQTAASAPSNSGDESLVFAWPHPGQVLTGFDETKNKGLDFAGKAGDPVLAAADGKVVYAGSGLRGYGNLVILKHNNTYLTAYAHNQSLLVKEDQTVQKGQRIAEMGSSDADRVKLHFEIRKQGKPVDPAKLLPSRP